MGTVSVTGPWFGKSGKYCSAHFAPGMIELRIPEPTRLGSSFSKKSLLKCMQNQIMYLKRGYPRYTFWIAKLGTSKCPIEPNNMRYCKKKYKYNVMFKLKENA